MVRVLVIVRVIVVVVCWTGCRGATDGDDGDDDEWDGDDDDDVLGEDEEEEDFCSAGAGLLFVLLVLSILSGFAILFCWETLIGEGTSTGAPLGGEQEGRGSLSLLSTLPAALCLLASTLLREALTPRGSSSASSTSFFPRENEGGRGLLRIVFEGVKKGAGEGEAGASLIVLFIPLGVDEGELSTELSALPFGLPLLVW